MRSFIAIVSAGTLALLTLLLLTPSAIAQASEYALKITLEENGTVFDSPQIVVMQGKSYYVELSGNADYDFRVDIPADTQAAALEQFDRNLGQWAQDFMVVNAQLSFPESTSEVANEKPVISNLLLRKDGRAIKSAVPVSDRNLMTRSGKKVETLSITIEANPFG